MEGLDQEIMTQWISKKLGRRCGLDSSDPECTPLTASCRHGNKPSGSIQGNEFVY
jgi:hypothetical protein